MKTTNEIVGYVPDSRCGHCGYAGNEDTKEGLAR
jgi:Na+-translocating ferredoxin:NAD+ oxidoreductase RNF subunit RnfB